MMRRRLVLKAACTVFLTSAVLRAQQSPDDAQLRQRIADHQAASEHGDLRGLVDIYALDAEIVSGDGKVLRGRDAIEADYRNSLASASSRSGRHHIHPTESIRIVFITPEVAVIEVAAVNVGGTDAKGAPLGESRAQLVTIWRKAAGEWLVVYQRAVPVPPA